MSQEMLPIEIEGEPCPGVRMKDMDYCGWCGRILENDDKPHRPLKRDGSTHGIVILAAWNLISTTATPARSKVFKKAQSWLEREIRLCSGEVPEVATNALRISREPHGAVGESGEGCSAESE